MATPEPTLADRLDADELDCALRTLADLAQHPGYDPHDVLSERQKDVAELVVSLVGAEAGPLDPPGGPNRAAG